MTDITPLVAAGRQVIEAYAPGGFRINGQIFRSGVIVMPARVLPWRAGVPAIWSEEDFSGIFPYAGEVDILLLGSVSGTVPAELKFRIKERGMSLDVMDAGAACRTYNVLMAEDRKVVAALLPPG